MKVTVRCVCGCSHTYVVVEQSTIVRNSAFARRQSGTSPRIMLKLKLPKGEQYSPPTIPVPAICPTMGRAITVRLIETDLTEQGLDPKRVSLALIGSGGQEQRGARP